MADTKRCNDAKHEGPRDLPVSEFGRDIGSVSGLRSRCKKCENQLRQERRDRLKQGHLAREGVPPQSVPAAIVAPPVPIIVTPPQPKIVVVEETITQVEEHNLKRRIRDLEAERREMLEQLSKGGEMQKIIDEVKAMQGTILPRINPRERTSKLAEATPLVLASDWHIEEEVRPEQVEDRNRYNLEIATRRMERFFEATRWGIDHQRTTPFKIRDMILWLGGDLITNFLHEDNVESNLLHPIEAALMVQAEVTKGIDYLLQDPELEQIIIPCNDGNHGRLTKKMRSATRTKNSIEVLIYAQLALHFRNEKRVRFILPESSFLFLPNIYGRTIRFLHGDVFRYQGGIGGLTIPLFRALGRWETFKHADLTCLGHWHQRICLPSIMVNGCFESGTRVITDKGPRAIETVVPGDRVLSRDGSLQVVEKTLVKSADDLVILRAKGLPNVLACTPNHEFWAVKGESSNTTRPGREGPRSQTTVLQEKPAWYRAEHLSEGDWVHTPMLKGTREMDLDLLFSYGLFLAEGHTILDGGATKKHHRIEFSMHVEELHILEQVKVTLDRALEREGRIWTRPERTSSHLSYTGRDVAERFRNEFGHLSIGKKIPVWMLDLSPQCRQAVVQGWVEGDGHRGKCVTAVSTSEDLAWGMYMLAIGTGLEPMLYVQTKRDDGPKGPCSAWRVSFVEGQDVRWIDGERFVRIDYRRRERRSTTVHDLQVSGEHTYCVEGFGVHNSLIGFNTYAQDIGAAFEHPVQSMRMLLPERWTGSDIPLFVSESYDDVETRKRKTKEAA